MIAQRAAIAASTTLTELLAAADDALFTDTVQRELIRVLGDKPFTDPENYTGGLAIMHWLTQDPGFFQELDQDHRMQISLRLGTLLIFRKVDTQQV